MAVAGMCASCFDELWLGLHRANHVYKLALYEDSAKLSEHTTAYSAAHEIPASGSYKSGGAVLEGYEVAGGCLHFDDVTFTKATITKPKYGLVYNSSVGDRAVAVLEFPDPQESVLGTFRVELPVPLLGMRRAKT